MSFWPRRERPSPATKPEFRTFGGPANALEVVGVRTSPLRDLFHSLLLRPWWVTIAVIGTAIATANLLFATGYWLVGGVANARPGSFTDAFFFSVETLGTIGYGNMYPAGLAAHVLVTLESLVGVIVIALSTGIAFAKFARSDAQIVFSRECTVSLMDGVPHLIFRVANQKGHLVTSARLHVTLLREHRTAEGMQIFRMLDLSLVRDHHPAFRRTWTVMHRIDAASPLAGATPESLMAEETEVIVSLEGMDVTTSITVTAQHSYLAREIIFGARHVDIWSDLQDGRSRVDYNRFHDLVPMAPAPHFPYVGGKRLEP